MPKDHGAEEPGSAGAVPLHGTQSLVGVMGYVWRHPLLTILEVLWRWLAGIPLLWLLERSMAKALSLVPVDLAGLGDLTVFNPVHSIAVLSRQARLYLPVLLHTARWWIPLALLVWTAASTLGRTVVARRAEPPLQRRLAVMAGCSLARATAFVLLLAAWAAMALAAIRFTLISPAQRGAEPSVVLFTAALVALTLAAFLLWSVLAWPLDLIPLRAMATLQSAAPQGRVQLRSKLIEANLVMGIVRVALLVLAMTFSASPLPFQSQQTQSFITAWWCAVGLGYLLASDYFHVVRRVTYLRLLQSTATPLQGTVSAAS